MKSIMRIITLEMERNKDLGNDNLIYIGYKQCGREDVKKKTNQKCPGWCVAQCIECRPANQRVTSSIPSQGTCLVCRLGPQCRVHERQPHIDVSLPLFLLSFLSKNKLIKSFKKPQNFKYV